jgi:hypothetical protein
MDFGLIIFPTTINNCFEFLISILTNSKFKYGKFPRPSKCEWHYK